MPLTIKRGTNIPLSQRTVTISDPVRGLIKNYEYDGAGQPEMLALFQSFVNAGCSVQLVLEHDKASMSVEDATQAVGYDTWQVLANEETRDGLSHPKVLSILPTPDLIATMRKYVEQIETGAKTIADFTADPKFAGLNTATLTRFIDLQMRGSTGFRRGQYVLRHTTNVSNRSSANVADVGVETIYTTAQLLSEVRDSGLWEFPLPDRLAYKISNIPTPPEFPALALNPDAVGNYQWGWLKSASTEQTAANNRIDITTEYVLELWSLDYYDAR